MTPEPVEPRSRSRRRFLADGLTAGAALAAASTVGALLDVVGASDAFALDTKTFFPLVLSADLYAQAAAQRFVFALGHNGAHGIVYASGPAVSIRFRPPGGAWTPFAKTTYDPAGLPKNRGVYRSTPVFDRAGVWKAEARVEDRRTQFSIQVADGPATVAIGRPAVQAASPTTTNALGVAPICTRSPQCTLHGASAADVIGRGKPVALIFATPARCQSQYCGPVLDELLKVMGPYQDKVTFLHVEIYKSLTDPAYVPTVTAWNLPSEPWLFGIDAQGVVRARIDGAFAGTEMKKLLDGLAASTS